MARGEKGNALATKLHRAILMQLLRKHRRAQHRDLHQGGVPLVAVPPVQRPAQTRQTKYNESPIHLPTFVKSTTNQESATVKLRTQIDRRVWLHHHLHPEAGLAGLPPRPERRFDRKAS